MVPVLGRPVIDYVKDAMVAAAASDCLELISQASSMRTISLVPSGAASAPAVVPGPGATGAFAWGAIGMSSDSFIVFWASGERDIERCGL